MRCDAMSDAMSYIADLFVPKLVGIPIVGWRILHHARRKTINYLLSQVRFVFGDYTRCRRKPIDLQVFRRL